MTEVPTDFQSLHNMSERSSIQMPNSVAFLRQETCRKAGCIHNPDYADPLASCPAGHWFNYRPYDSGFVPWNEFYESDSTCNKGIGAQQLYDF